MGGKEKIVLVGFGGHAKSVIDTILSMNKYSIIGYTDFESRGVYRDIKWLGTDEVLKEIYNSGCRYAFITIGYMGCSDSREKIYDKLKKIGYTLPVIADSTSIIAGDTLIEEGTYVGKKAVINSAVQVGKISIINTAAVVEHENIIGNNVHVAGGAVICGNVIVGNNCLIGANATVIQGTKIDDNTIIGAGSVVLKGSIGDCVMAGNPAKIIKKRI